MGLHMDEIFASGMILQRNRENKLYGYDLPGAEISLTIDGDKYLALADHTGYWEVVLAPRKEGGPFCLEVRASEVKKLSDVYFGDLFLLTGQSNMELLMERAKDLYEEEISQDIKGYKQAKLPIIRQFTMNKEHAFFDDDKRQIKGQWDELTEESLVRISAVGYFFAKKHQELQENVPVGLIQTALGGSPIESWCSEEDLRELKPECLNEMEWLKNDKLVRKIQKEEEIAAQKWYSDLFQADQYDKAYNDGDYDWEKWDSLSIPCNYFNVPGLAAFTGCIWLKRKFYLTKEELGRIRSSDRNSKLTLYFGTVIDRDDVWINEKWIGMTPYQYPPRQYQVAKEILKEGENTITLRHVVEKGQGAFPKGKGYRIALSANHVKSQWSKTLRGQWHYRVGARAIPPKGSTFFTWKPTALYRGMLYPLRRFAFTGVLWYQGESNVDAMETKPSYGTLFCRMVERFRTLFNDEKLPLVFGLLAGMDEGEIKVKPGRLARFRINQLTGLSMSYTAVASTLDLGEYNDIHPLRKKPVGERMALSMNEVMERVRCDEKQTDIYVGPQVQRIYKDDLGITIVFNTHNKELMIKKKTMFHVRFNKTASEGLQGYPVSIEELYHDEPYQYWDFKEAEMITPNTMRILRFSGMDYVDRIGYGLENFPRHSGLYDEEGLPALPFLYSL